MAIVSEDKPDRLAILSITIRDRFEIIKRLGSGAFGEVFLAKNIRTNELCALKTERTDAKHPQLKIEQEIFARMQNCEIDFRLFFLLKCLFVSIDIGFPSIGDLIEANGFVILTMDLLGPSLEDLLNFCQREFTRKTVLMLMDQAIQRIQHLHEQSVIHRDVRFTGIDRKCFCVFFVV